jgi:hypothetical protein
MTVSDQDRAISKNVVNLAVLGLVLVLPGCGQSSGPTRYDVQGRVTWNGKPVPSGMITFTALESNEFGDGFASIVDGAFDTRSGGRGHFGGQHKVVITGAVSIDLNDLDAGTKKLFNPYETTVDFPNELTTRNFTVE